MIKNDTEKKITSINNNNDIEDSFSDDDMKISKRKDFSFEDEEEIETVLELNGDNKNKNYINNKWKEKNDKKIERIIEVDEENNESLKESHNSNSKNRNFNFKDNIIHKINDNQIDNMLSSNNDMKHIKGFDVSLSSKKNEFEPKELEGSINFNHLNYKSNRDNKHLNLNNISNGNIKDNNNNNENIIYKKLNNPFTNETAANNLLKNDPFNIIDSTCVNTTIGNYNNQPRGEKLKLDDLENENTINSQSNNPINNNNKINDNNNNIINNINNDLDINKAEDVDKSKNKQKKIVKVKNIEELKKILKEMNDNQNSINNSNSDDSSIYYIIEGNNNMEDIKEEDESFRESQSNLLKNSQILKVKGNVISDEENDNFENKIFFDEKENYNNEKNIVNIPHKRKLNRLKSQENPSKNKLNKELFPIKKISVQKMNNNNNLNNKKNDNFIETFQGIFKRKSNNLMKNTLPYQNKKNYKIIEQIKKERSGQENSSSSFQNNSLNNNNNHSFSTQKILMNENFKRNLNNNNNSINNNINIREEYSHTQGSDFKKNKYNIENNNNNIIINNKTFKKSKSKPIMSPIKNNIINTPKFNSKVNSTISNKKNNNKYNVNNIPVNNLEKNIINQSKNEEENTYKMLRQRYLDYLIKTFGEDNKPILTKEEEEMNENVLKDLVKNEIAIENDNLDNINCSNDMKAFLIESLKNFKLNQMKEKIKLIKGEKESISNIELTKSNLLNLIQVDYDDDNHENRNVLEPIELEKSGIYFRKFFVDSLRESSHNNYYVPKSKEPSRRYDNYI